MDLVRGPRFGRQTDHLGIEHDDGVRVCLGDLARLVVTTAIDTEHVLVNVRQYGEKHAFEPGSVAAYDRVERDEWRFGQPRIEINVDTRTCTGETDLALRRQQLSKSRNRRSASLRVIEDEADR